MMDTYHDKIKGILTSYENYTRYICGDSNPSWEAHVKKWDNFQRQIRHKSFNSSFLPYGSALLQLVSLPQSPSLREASPWGPLSENSLITLQSINRRRFISESLSRPLAHSFNKVQEFFASVGWSMIGNRNVGTWLDAPPLILACFIAFIHSFFDSSGFFRLT